MIELGISSFGETTPMEGSKKLVRVVCELLYIMGIFRRLILFWGSLLQLILWGWLLMRLMQKNLCLKGKTYCRCCQTSGRLTIERRR